MAGLIAGVAILAFLGASVASGWERVSAYDWEVRPDLLLAALVVLGAFYVVGALGYVRILEHLSARRLERRRFVAIWGRSLLGRYVPGNVLMVAGRVVLGHEAGVSRRVTLAASVYEQVLVLGAAAIGGVVLLVAYAPAGIGGAVLAAALVPPGLVLLHPRIFEPATGWLLRKAGRPPLDVVMAPRQLVVMLAWFMGAAVLLGAGVWLAVRGTAGPGSGDPAYVGLAFLLAFVVSMLAFVFPSGIGVREGVFAALLAVNLPGGVAIALAAGVRLLLTAAELIFVGAAVLLARRRIASGAPP